MRERPWLLGEGHLRTGRAGVREFVQAPEYLGLGDTVFPGVLETLEEMFSGGYDEAVICWGIGSGKSYLGALALAYMAHCVLCLRDPQRSLGVAPGSSIVFLVAAPSARQARQVVFATAKRQMETSPWFRAHAPGTDFLATEIRFPQQVAIVAGNSSTTFPLGYNVLGAVVDEAAWFTTEAEGEEESVEEVYNGLKRRVLSRFNDRGFVLVISSPRTGEDFLERRLRVAESDSRVLGSRRPTWEVRPGRMYCGETFRYEGMDVPVEYRREFEVNPQRALRDLAARPTAALHPYLTDWECLEAAKDERLRHPFDTRGRLEEWFRPKGGQARYVHIDLGLKHDACGIAMAYCEESRAEGGRPEVVVELMHRIKAPKGGEVDLATPREIVLSLRERGFPIGQVSYDGWQSADSRQILGRHGVSTRTVSVDRTMEAYETLKGLLVERRLRTYAYPPFEEEMRRLELVAGRKVDHPPGGSKDVADAVAGAVCEAVKRGSGRGMRATVV